VRVAVTFDSCFKILQSMQFAIERLLAKEDSIVLLAMNTELSVQDFLSLNKYKGDIDIFVFSVAKKIYLCFFCEGGWIRSSYLIFFVFLHVLCCGLFNSAAQMVDLYIGLKSTN
jgi:hypothetical protein